MRPRPPENGDGDGPRTRGRARCHLCELAYCERTSAEPPETTDLIRFCPPLHPFVSERASYGKVAQMVFSWGRASANNYSDSHRPRDGRVLTDLQVLTGLGMCYDPNNCWQTHRRPFGPPAPVPRYRNGALLSYTRTAYGHSSALEYRRTRTKHCPKGPDTVPGQR